MGTILERPRKNGSICYQAMIKIPGGKAIVKSFDDIDLASRFIDAVESERESLQKLRESKPIKPSKPESVPAHERVALMEGEKLSDAINTFRKTDKCLRRHRDTLNTILTHIALIGDITIGEVKIAWVKKYLAHMRKQKTYRGTQFTWETLSTHLTIMALSIKHCAEELEVSPPVLPFSKKLFPKNWETKRDRRLAKSEEVSILRRIKLIDRPCKHHWRHLVKLALETGARLQELVFADWSEFDLDRRVWTIPAQHTKTRQSRTVPLSKAAMRSMKILCLITKPNDSRVFHRISSPAVASAMFHRYVVEMQIKDLRFHDLRHEAISRMVLFKRQLSVFEIMTIVGHSSLEMFKRYANLRGDELVKSMN